MAIVWPRFAVKIHHYIVKSTHSLFIADSNETLLDGLTVIVSQEPTFHVVGTARTATELADKAMCCTPDIYLVDLDLAYMNSSRFSQRMFNQTETVRIIILTDHWESSLIRRMKAIGVMGCLRKTCDANELIFAIHRVLDGKTYYSGYHEEDLKSPSIKLGTK